MKNEIGNVIGKWQKDNRVRNLSPDTIESYGASARDFQAFFEQRKIHKMKQITDDVIRDYTLCQIDRGCAPRTINSRLKALRRLLNFYKAEIRPSYTVPNIRLQREECTSRGPLTDDQVCMLVRNFSPQDTDSVLVAFILDTGIRSKSVRHVKVDDLDFENGLVVIRVTKNHEVLVLPLSEALRNLLKEYIALNQITDGYLFRNRNGGGMYDRSTVYKFVKRYLRRCGVQKSGAHLFRYTFGKIMVENNCNAMLLQKWFGHRTMDETKRYIRLYSSELKEACERVTPLAKNGKIYKKIYSEGLTEL